jgi:hypothetical protein
VAHLVVGYKPGGQGFDPSWCHWNFYCHNPSDRTMVKRSTQSLKEMSIRNISWGLKAVDA